MIEADSYEDVNHFMNQEIYNFIKSENVQFDAYNSNLFFDYITNKNDVEVFSQQFRETSKGSISGMLVRDDLGTTITYNSLHPKVRQNFTKGHELTHFLKHIDNLPAEFSLKESDFSYDESSNLMEYEANIGASHILLPDIILLEMIQKPISFQTVSSKYGMSESALFFRLRDFLVYRCKLNPVRAINLVNQYRYTGEKEWIYRSTYHFGSPYKKIIINEFEESKKLTSSAKADLN